MLLPFITRWNPTVTRVACASFMLAGAACSSSSTSSLVVPDIGGGGTNDGTIQGIAVTAAAELIRAQEGDSAGRSFDSADTDYSNTQTQVWVHLDASDALSTVNTVLCVVSRLGAHHTEVLNNGMYIAQVNVKECDGQRGGGGPSTASSAGEEAVSSASYVPTFVISTRASNDAPQYVTAWIPMRDPSSESDGGGDGPTTEDTGFYIRAEAVVTAAASDNAPFGILRISWDMGGQGGGTLWAYEGSGGQGGFRFVEASTRSQHMGQNEQVEMTQVQSAVTQQTGDGSEGTARTSTQVTVAGTVSDQVQQFLDEMNKDYVLSYNSGAVKYSVGGQETCLDRTSTTTKVWRYSLFDATTGSLVDRSGNIQFTYACTKNGTPKTASGSIGYWGAYASDSACPLSDGISVTEKAEGQQHGVLATYTFHDIPGRLTRVTPVQKSLDDVIGAEIQFQAQPCPQQNQNNNNMNMPVTYLGHIVPASVRADRILITGQLEYGSNGQAVNPLSQPVTLNDAICPIYGWGLNAYSPDLGGQVRWPQVPGTFGQASAYEDYVIVSQETPVLPGDALFTSEGDSNGLVTFVCLDWSCPKGGATVSDLQNNQAMIQNPYNAFNLSTTIDDAPQYVMSSSTTGGHNMLTLYASQNDAPVVFPADLSSQNGPQQYWLSGGKLVPQSAAADFHDSSSVYYRWDTGLANQSWSRRQWLTDVTDEIVLFDTPLEFNYVHSQANDRNGDATYAGLGSRFQYAAPGNLWGIASEKDPNSDRWYPKYSLRNGVTIGNGAYVIKALEGEQVLNESNTACADLSFNSDLGSLPVAADIIAPSHADVASENYLPPNKASAVIKVRDGALTE